MQDLENNHKDYGIERKFWSEWRDSCYVSSSLMLQKTEKPLNNESIYNFYQSLFSQGDVRVQR